MNTFQSIELFVVINLFVIGMSHWMRPTIWIEFFQFLYKKGNVGNIFNAMLSLGLGSIIFSFHFLWEWPMLLVTIYGLLQIIKGFIYLVFPSVGLKSIGKVDASYAKFKWVGIVMCILSILLLVLLVNDGAFIAL